MFIRWCVEVLLNKIRNLCFNSPQILNLQRKHHIHWLKLKKRNQSIIKPNSPEQLNNETTPLFSSLQYPQLPSQSLKHKEERCCFHSQKMFYFWRQAKNLSELVRTYQVIDHSNVHGNAKQKEYHSSDNGEISIIRLRSEVRNVF